MAMEENPFDAWGEEPEWAKESGVEDGVENVNHANEDEEFESHTSHHILLLIDCHPEMFESIFNVPNSETCVESKTCAFDIAIKAAGDLVTQCIRDVAISKGNKRNGVGIMLYGTKYYHDMDRHGDLTSNYNLLKMQPPGIEQIHQMYKCVSKQRDLQKEFTENQKNNLSQNINHPLGILPLRSALHSANKIFQTAKCVKNDKSSTDAKTIWIFTNQDDPFDKQRNKHRNMVINEDEQEKIIITAKDTKDNKVKIYLYPFPKSTSSFSKYFDRTKFYDHFTSTKSTSAHRHNHTDNQSICVDDVLEEIMQQWKKIRKIFTLPFLLPGYLPSKNDSSVRGNLVSTSDHNMFLDFYRPINVQKPRGIIVNKKNNKPTHRTTMAVAKETGERLNENIFKLPDHNQLYTYMLFAGKERVPIKENEVKLIKQQSHSHPQSVPSLILLGFKSNNPNNHNSIPEFHTMDRAYYAYPNEDDPPYYGSSRRAVSTLYHSMLERNVAGIGELLTKPYAMSRLVAIIPQREQISEDRGQVLPPGFVIVFLPFQDDVRYPSMKPPENIDNKVQRVKEKDDLHNDETEKCCSEEMIEAACNLIRSQHAVESVDWEYDIPNPMIQKFWNHIEHVAVGDILREGNGDGIDNSEDVLQMQTYQILRAAGSEIDAFRDSLPKENHVKLEGNKRKRKGNEVRGDFDRFDEEHWIQLHQDDKISCCNVNVLKIYLRYFGGEKNIRGKKAELVQRVQSRLERRLKEKNKQQSVPEKKAGKEDVSLAWL